MQMISSLFTNIKNMMNTLKYPGLNVSFWAICISVFLVCFGFAVLRHILGIPMSEPLKNLFLGEAEYAKIEKSKESDMKLLHKWRREHH